MPDRAPLSASTLFCPTCGQKLPPKERRICGRCQQPILAHHKYCFQGSTVMHRYCEEPYSYGPPTAPPATAGEAGTEEMRTK